jgi:N-acyl-D-aspartate/D-glutamate deacylase
MFEYDLVIRGGTIVDGSGADSYVGDIAVKDGIIAQLGEVTAKGAEEIDAAGVLVTPGFIDIHTHYDGQATWASRMSPSSHHGVTTAVLGNCGVGFAPVRPEDRDLLIELMEGVEDIPGAALHEGLTWEWESFPDYLDFLEKREFDMDVATQLPHGALRVYVMGKRGSDGEPATEDDIRQMRQLTKESMEAGALGFSSSRTINHRSSNGSHTPSLTAEMDEMVGIALGVKDAGKGVIEMISDFKDLDAEFSIVEAMAKNSDRPMSISLAQGLSPNDWRDVMAHIEKAVDKGLEVRGQVAPRAIGVMLGLSTTLNPFMDTDSFASISTLSLSDKVVAMSDPDFKSRLLNEMRDKDGPEGVRRMFRNFDRIWEFGDIPDYEPLPENSIAARAEKAGRDPSEFFYDISLKDNGRKIMYTPFANYEDYNLDCCREMILNENTVMGLGDGGAHVGTICDASFSTYLLSHWGKNRTRGPLIDMPTLVRKQTGACAAAVGLTDRGVLEVGKKADINVIDMDNLIITTPVMVNDLPLGGARVEQLASGYSATIVSGKITYRNGEATGALPGRLVRS